jgi:RHS repeat-associated protein
MALGSSWLDLVVGVDIHLHYVPMPGPVPTPLPQPFVGLVGDPVGAIVGEMQSAVFSLMTTGQVSLPTGPVLINGLPATTTSSVAKNRVMLLHLPMPPGTAHVKPPAGDATFPLGSLNVTFGGSSAVRGGEIAISCGDPPLPTSAVIPIPKGPPVMVGGAPGFNVGQAVTKWVMGRAIRTAWRGVGKLAKVAGRLSLARRRNLVSVNKATCTSDPIDVATGRVLTEATDFALPGRLPLTLTRNYSSAWGARDGVLGLGWSHSLDQALWFEPGLAVYRNAEGQEIVFDGSELEGVVPVGREVFEPISRNTLVRTRAGWKIVTAEGLIHQFARVAGETDERIAMSRIVRTTTRNEAVAIAYSYGPDGRLAEIEDCAGRIVKLEHESGRLARVLLPHPDVEGEWLPHAEYRYSAVGQLIEVRDAYGNPAKYDYDGGLLVQRTDRNGFSFYWCYDGRGAAARCVRTWGDGGIYNQKLDYDPANGITLLTDSYDNKTMYKMNALGAVIEVMDPLGGKTIKEYDDALQLVAETDPLGQVTRYDYGPRGQLNLTTLPDGSQIVQKYDPRFPELVKLVRNEAGFVWRYAYDQHGELLDVRGPEADVWCEYEWEEGSLKAVVDASGRAELVQRESSHSSVIVKLANGALIRRQHDRRGRLRVVTNPYGAREEIDYDLLDRLVEVLPPEGGRRCLRYDLEGNVLEAGDGVQNVRFTYAGSNKLSSREEGVGTDVATTATTRLVWGLEGEIREIRNERNHDHRFLYDSGLRLVGEVAFDLQETRYCRDKAGRIVKIEKLRARTHSKVTLDSLGRTTAVEHSDGTFAKFRHRRDGFLLEATNQSTTVTFDRDAIGRVVAERQADVEVTSRYSRGFRTAMESSQGAKLTITRDGFGNATVIAVGDLRDSSTSTIALEHDAAGFDKHRSLPGGVTEDWRRDGLGRPVQHTTRAPRDAWAQELSWRGDGLLATATDTRFGRAVYERDGRGRLMSEQIDGVTNFRRLDEVGNVYRTSDLSDRRYVRGGILRRDEETTFEFDSLGNLISKASPGGREWRYTWDGAGFLTQVASSDGRQISFAYDALGRRVRKKVGDVETTWIWDGDVVLHERRGPTTTTWYHEPETFTPLAKVEGDGATYSVVTDHLGTPTALYDAAGTLAWQMQLDLYGLPRLGDDNPDHSFCPWRWPGQYEDAETGLHYNRFRYYDPRLGEYISQDPLGLSASLAAYAYADPVESTDPLGLMSCPSPERGYVSGYRIAMERARAARRGDGAAAAEIRAARYLRDHGVNVHFQKAGLRRSKTGETADFLVDGDRGTGRGGRPYDVFSPEATKPDAVFRGIRNKDSQTTGVIVDFSRTPVKPEQLGNVMARLRGCNATNIQDVFYLP